MRSPGRSAARSLRIQVLGLLALLFVPAALASLVLVPNVVSARFEAIEREQLRQATQIASANLQAEGRRVGLFVLNFSLWSETFDFAAGRNPEYLAANLVPGTFKGGRVDYWGIQDAAGRLRSAATFERERVVPATALVTALFGQLPRPLPAEGAEGVAQLGGRAYVVAARPITRDDGSGNGGAMLLARELTPAVLSGLMYGETAFRVRLTAQPPASPQLRLEAAEGVALSALPAPKGPAQLALQVAVSRAVSQAGQATIAYLRLVTILTALLLAAGLLLFLNRRVLGVLEGYGRDTQRIAGDPTHRLASHDRTELGLLAGTINELLDHLQTREAQLRARAHHDDLTGALTPAGLLEELGEVPHARCILLVEVMRLQELSGLYGDGFVDTLLAALADRMRAAGPQYLVARLSTTTLALVSRGPSDFKPAALLARLAQPFPVQDGEVSVNFTAGYAEAPDALPAPALLRHANIALQHALDVHEPLGLFTDELLRRSQEAHQLEMQLAGAATRGELSVVYQPVAEVATGRWSAMEALLRWTHPTLGPVSPATFIPLAERSGQIYALGDWALRAAVQEVQAVRAQWPQVRVNVNVSPVQLLMPDFAAHVLSTLDDLKAPADILTVEVTESTVMQNLDLACVHLARLRSAGIRVALDDFGSGHSSLSLLSELPLDTVKLDRSFLRATAENAGRQALLRSTVGLARDLGLQVVAEGVEDQAMLDWLGSLSCDYVQGYYIARPQPLATLLPQRPGAARQHPTPTAP
ncbi:EAL domain-containing protein [Deinococcus sp. HMF7604]|uniref:putative bifunctional diguanylate cyclase/phosphodiesterase n=1 Tax=Deinococcus betulae TaxID=2873312 RepID=UPI001CCB0944|nr:EAL domain-containing protein [Deinococcus betulae]MBZ9749828.1 EAL domain-containing protein [Deinococcus betulae]